MLTYTKHEKISLRKHPIFNEKWLHDRICEEPTLLGLGDVRVLDRERIMSGGGRLDLLLFDEENDRRYEVEIQLGATDPSHIIRCIEYWDLERRLFPGYQHVGVLIAEEVTARFLNVMALLSGSISMVAIQLDALSVGNQLLLHFTQILDQRDLRVDDTEIDGGGGGQTDRQFWEKKAGLALMKICDEVVAMINASAKSSHELNYLRQYIGLQSYGVVDNFIHMSPKPAKKYTHLHFRNSNATTWKDKLDAAELPVSNKRKDHLRVSVTADEFESHKDLIQQLVSDTVKDWEN